MPRFLYPLLALASAALGCGLPQPADPPAPDSARRAAPVPARGGAESSRLPLAPMPRPAGVPREPDEPDKPDGPPFTDLNRPSDDEAAIPELRRDESGGASVWRRWAALAGLELPEPLDPPAGLDRDEFRKAHGNEDKDVGPFGPFDSRRGAAKVLGLQRGGGNMESERAVGMGLAWLARQQQEDGGWAFDSAAHKDERVAATASALLPFLGAGVTHFKPTGTLNEFIDGKGYEKVVARGLDFLKKNCPLAGAAAGRMTAQSGKEVQPYAQALATLALCEAFAMTKDPGLRPHAQAAVNFIQKTQGPNGSWGHGHQGEGDIFVTGLQVQALGTARLSKELVVSNAVIKKANTFLDGAAGGSRKSSYGTRDKTDAAPGTPATAVGLLCRYLISEWGPLHPGLVDGAGGLMRKAPKPGDPLQQLLFHAHATQVLYGVEGEDWKTWNEGKLDRATNRRYGGMRDWLVRSQVRAGKDAGSWDAETGDIGATGGRLGTTCAALLMLEVYYRCPPLYKRGADGKAILIIETDGVRP